MLPAHPAQGDEHAPCKKGVKRTGKIARLDDVAMEATWCLIWQSKRQEHPCVPGKKRHPYSTRKRGLSRGIDRRGRHPSLSPYSNESQSRHGGHQNSATNHLSFSLVPTVKIHSPPSPPREKGENKERPESQKKDLNNNHKEKRSESVRSIRLPTKSRTWITAPRP